MLTYSLLLRFSLPSLSSLCLLRYPYRFIIMPFALPHYSLLLRFSLPSLSSLCLLRYPYRFINMPFALPHYYCFTLCFGLPHYYVP